MTPGHRGGDPAASMASACRVSSEAPKTSFCVSRGMRASSWIACVSRCTLRCRGLHSPALRVGSVTGRSDSYSSSGQAVARRMP